MNKFNLLYKAALVLLFVSGFALGGCHEEAFTNDHAHRVTPDATDGAKQEIPWVPGEAYVKLVEGGSDSASSLSSTLHSSVPLTRSGNLKMEPVFDISGEYAPAMRREGLDRWYKITFDKGIDVQSVIDALKTDESVEIVHGGLQVVQNKLNYTAYHEPVSATRSGDFPDVNNGYSAFNNADPLLRKQWHYSNEGMREGFVQGADINLFEAWEKTTGDSRVVVAIIDSGIDTTHPDLQGSMWKDKDGHYGKNFLDNNYTIDPGFHGTHVGGTVGARSNNGIGVAGVAGGDGNTNTGVRLMSCQIFGPDRPDGTSQAATTDQIAQSFIWAAQNGALIANCSWGFPWNPQKHFNSEDYKNEFAQASTLIQAGIDFFIKYAGNDSNGNPKSESLMSGGVVFFATGNDFARDVEIAPASNPLVIAVGSFTPDFTLARYSNTGTWVDVLAPGGVVDEHIEKGILSTVPTAFGNIKIGDVMGNKYLYPGQTQYAFANGTSMATPHVTGIAALMVSHFGKQGGGFTNKELRKRLLGAIKAQSLEKASKDVALKGKMGVGFIDAGYALSEPEKTAPKKVEEIKVLEANYYDAKISWTVTADEDAVTQTAFAYDIYLNDSETAELSNRTDVVYSHEKKTGESLEYQFKELESDKTYYVSVVARDRSGNRAAAASVRLKTKLNHAPQIMNPFTEKLFILDTRPFYKYSFKVQDQDPDQTWTHEVSNLPKGVTLLRNGENLDLAILVDGQVGTYSFDITLTDNLRGKRVEKVEYEIVKHYAPRLIAEIGDVSFFEDDRPMRIELKDLFEVTPGLGQPKFEVKSNNKEVAEANIDNREVVVTPRKRGTATITIIVDDGQKKSHTTFQVRVTDKSASDVHALYPVPAHSYLKILMRSDVEKVDVTVTSVRGEVLISSTLEVKQKQREATLDIDRLAPGVYNLIVKSERTTSKRTFIKN